MRLPAVETHKQSFMDALSFALRGAQDDGTIRQALEANSSHADSYVARQWAHRSMLTSRTSTSFEQNHSKTPKIFGPPVTVSSMCEDVADLFKDGEAHTMQNRRVWVDTVRPLHLLIAANTLRRPIIVFEPGKRARLQEAAMTSLEGVYLPVACSPDTCIGDPLLLLHKPGGFDLEGTKKLEVQYTSARLIVSLPCDNYLDQWFAPVIPPLPYEGDSVPLVLHEGLPFRYFLEDEGCDETLGMYLYTMSINVDGKLRRVVRYPILDPVCTGEGFVSHEHQVVLPPAMPGAKAQTSAEPSSKRVLPDGRLITVTSSDKPMDEEIFGAPSTLSQVLADAAGSEASGSTGSRKRPMSWWAWFRFQWFSQLWHRDHPDHALPADIVDKTEQADSQAAKPREYVAASGFSGFTFSQFGIQMPRISVPSMPGWQLPVWNAFGQNHNLQEPPGPPDGEAWNALSEEERQKWSAEAQWKFPEMHLPRFSFPPMTGPDLARFEFPQYSGSDRVVDEEAIKRRPSRLNKQSNGDSAAPCDSQESHESGQGAAERQAWRFGMPAIPSWSLPSWRSSGASGNAQKLNSVAMVHEDAPASHHAGDRSAKSSARFSSVAQQDAPASRQSGSLPGKSAGGKSQRSVEEICELPPMPEATPLKDSPNMPEFKSYKDMQHTHDTEEPRAAGAYKDVQHTPDAEEPRAAGGLKFPQLGSLPDMPGMPGAPNLHLPGFPSVNFPSWKAWEYTARKPVYEDAGAATSRDEKKAENANIPAVLKAKPSGILGFLMKANTPPKSDRYSVMIEKIVPGTSAALAGEVAVGDEVLEISGEEVKYLWEDGPNSEELMKRLQQKLADSPDHVTLKVLQEDGRTNSYRVLRAPIIVPGIQVVTCSRMLPVCRCSAVVGLMCVCVFRVEAMEKQGLSSLPRANTSLLARFEMG